MVILLFSELHHLLVPPLSFAGADGQERGATMAPRAASLRGGVVR
jgi:hypothetical protein